MVSPASITYGPSLIGTMLSLVLYGIQLSQTFLYFTTYPNDRRWLKLFVAALLLADTVNCIFDVCWVYGVLITHFADLDALLEANWLMASGPAMVGIISSTVQLFYAWRVKVLTGNLWITGFIVITSLGFFFGAMGVAIAIHIVPLFSQFQRFECVVIFTLLCAASCDIVIAATLTWYLQHHKTGFPPTDDLLNRIIRVTVQNGLITSLWATANLVAFCSSTSGLHLAFNVPLGKLYTNSILSTLNRRTGWQTKQEAEAGWEMSRMRAATVSEGAIDTWKSQDERRAANVVRLAHTGETGGTEIFVQVESHEMSDSISVRKGSRESVV